ncbi:NADPH dehydrogenase NamA [Pelosinus sp. UFO1]|uniref:NADPH dehydrogenase NamA n=1 Tax=Pelosinus sp. UFO1 TaxID=484770 RepID=UPI0004D1AD1A|nr:NADPH dehydrogenase NamA [Pelosinus sp. UFO1]AIF53598.1 NADPH dehydrogenase [Pelosinus sp. UFO1]
MLFTPISFKQLTLKNRVVMPPMCMYSAADDGMVTDWHVTHYTTRAVGQVGLIIVEATGVEPRGRISNKDLGIWDDKHIAGLKSIVDHIHAQGGKIGIQLAHAGRKSEAVGSNPVAPSAIAFNEEYRLPTALTAGEIQEIIQKFVQGAKRAVAAGFDTIELHAAHGYLINEFLSPLTNLREDEYGGNLVNRVRFLQEVLIAVKQVIPKEMPVIVRVSADDYHEDGNTPEIVAEMLNLVKQYGIDIINVSSGAVIPVMPRAYPGYQVAMALTIKEKTQLPVLAGGLITEPAQAMQLVKAGIDLVYTGRELLRNPYWPLQAAHVLQQEVEWPVQYLRGKW